MNEVKKDVVEWNSTTFPFGHFLIVKFLILSDTMLVPERSSSFGPTSVILLLSEQM